MMAPMPHRPAPTVALAAALWLSACAGLPSSLQPGDTVDTVLQQLGPASAEYPLPGGGRKLQFASAPFGKHTYNVEFDADGRLLRWEEALTEARFNRVEPGLPAAAVRERFGPPARIWGVRYHDQTVWTYRYDNTQCQVFHIGLTPQGVVEDTSYGPDPMCEREGLFGHRHGP